MDSSEERWHATERERLRHVLELQEAIQRVRAAAKMGVAADPGDLALIEPLKAYDGPGLDRLWTTEDY